MSEKEIEQKKGLRPVNYIIGSILLIVGIIGVVLGFYVISTLYDTMSFSDMLEEQEFKTTASLLLLLGIYVSALGLHLLLQNLKQPIKGYMLFIFGIFILFFAVLNPRIVTSYLYLGLVAFLFFGIVAIFFSIYLLSGRYKSRKNLVYANVVMIIILLILVLVIGL